MKILTCFAVIAAMTGVILGAFAAHGLKGRLSETLLAVFQTGVQYQMYHALGILLVVVLHRQLGAPWLMGAASLMAVGILLFSGSLYLLALTGIKAFGPITPIGGLCFIAGWLVMLLALVKSSEW